MWDPQAVEAGDIARTGRLQPGDACRSKPSSDLVFPIAHPSRSKGRGPSDAALPPPSWCREGGRGHARGLWVRGGHPKPCIPPASPPRGDGDPPPQRSHGAGPAPGSRCCAPRSRHSQGTASRPVPRQGTRTAPRGAAPWRQDTCQDKVQPRHRGSSNLPRPAAPRREGPRCPTTPLLGDSPGPPMLAPGPVQRPPGRRGVRASPQPPRRGAKLFAQLCAARPSEPAPGRPRLEKHRLIRDWIGAGRGSGKAQPSCSPEGSGAGAGTPAASPASGLSRK